MTARSTYNWQCRDCTAALGRRTLVMGVLNITPDSFSDGGRFSDPGVAVERALAMAAEGAEIIDIGGESTRPGAAPVPAEEEIRRTVPVIRELRKQSDALISIDTTKAETAARAMDAGADIINDVSAFEADPAMVNIAAQTGAGVVLMHMKGTPRTMQDRPDYTDVVEDVAAYLDERIKYAIERGIDRSHLVIDPGIGFGKTVEHNLALLRGIPRLLACQAPLLIGVSRKSFIGHLLHREDPEKRRAGSLGAAAFATMQGAHILRVHDVIDTCDVCGLVDTLLAGDFPCN